MNVELVRIVLLIWPVVVAALFVAVGPRRAVLISVIGGFLFLPISQVKQNLFGFDFPIDKWNVTGLGLILGCVVFDLRLVLRARPDWLDLPIAAYYLSPLIGLATGVPGAPTDILDVMIGRGLGWVIPYATGRIYFSRQGGPFEVAVAVVLGGVIYIPVCLYEEIAGPSHYLATLIYGIPHSMNVDRLGGWRPNGFLGDGLVVAAWMALTAVTATWLWLGGGWRRSWQSGGIAIVLILATVSCRGLYGYLILAAGVGIAVVSRYLPYRACLLVLLAFPVAYMAIRLSGMWDAQLLIGGSDFTGRSGTVGWRIAAEDEVIGRVKSGAPTFGFGTYIWNAGISRWPDGAWLHALWMGGLVGLTLWGTALFLVPAAAGLLRHRGSLENRSTIAPYWALTCWCGLQLADCLHNTCYIPPLALIAATLVGAAHDRKTADH